MPKSLVTLPTQMISVSYGTRRVGQDLDAVVVADRGEQDFAPRAIEPR